MLSIRVSAAVVVSAESLGGQLCGTSAQERSEDRVNHRDEYRSRAWETLAARANVNIPRLRKGRNLAEFLEPRRAAERAMTAVVQQTYV
ncbi:transposase [Pararhodobacter oceanensis]|uniref:transposase n=1 Tax=Pararhodobacter oceanensis TaxID=2172121 RepID=UPI003A8DC109